MKRFQTEMLRLSLGMSFVLIYSCNWSKKGEVARELNLELVVPTKFASTDLDYEAKVDLEKGQLDLEIEHPKFTLGDWLDHPEVQTWVTHFEGPGRRGLLQQIKKGEPYRGMIEAVLKEKNLPSDFYFVALIESGFVNHARSSASAVGMWQFMKGTGKRYGLRINSYVDERRDPIRATVAAASYLSDLNRVFQSWFLALAAYSSGEGKVLNTIMNKGERDYWKIIRLNALPRETRNYVPKFIAAAWVGRKLQNEYSSDLDALRMPTTHGVKLSSGVPLSSVAQTVQMSVKDVKQFNQHLLRGITPPGNSSYTLWLPKTIVSQELELALLKLKSVGFAKSSGLTESGFYKIQAGDSLYSIARKFRTSVESLIELNQLKSKQIIAGKGIHISAPKTQAHKNVASSQSNQRYRVRRGDTLDAIARKHNTSLRQLKKYNKGLRNRIFPGQLLELPTHMM